MTIVANNSQFLKALFGDYEGSDCQPMANTFIGHPTLNGKWSGVPAQYFTDFPENNNYFSCSYIERQNGQFNRDMAHFAGMVVLVLDDIGTKAQEPFLPPTYVIETSENNFQWGYVLKEPLMDKDLAMWMQKHLPEEYCDRGGRNPIRWVRLPFGINGKNGFTTKLISFDANCKYTPEELIESFKIEEPNIQRRERIENSLKKQYLSNYDELLDYFTPIRKTSSGHNIRCPVKEHTQTPNLSIKRDGDRVVFYCHAGCSTHAVFEAFRAQGFLSDAPFEQGNANYGAFGENENGPISEPLRAINLLDWQGNPPERAWIEPDWIVANNPHLFTGSGGVGKSLLAQGMATHWALGKSFFGKQMAGPLKVGIVSCEDDSSELWRRQNDINASLGVSMEDVAPALFYLDRVGCENLVCTFGKDEVIKPTSFYEELCRFVGTYQIDVLILDNVAQIFAGNENSRPQVVQFVNLISRIWTGQGLAGTPILLSHPAKGNLSEYSGTTAWNGCVRVRLWMTFTDPDKRMEKKETWIDEGEDDKQRFLSNRKANYSAKETLELYWDAGVIKPQISMAGTILDKKEKKRQLPDFILEHIHILQTRHCVDRFAEAYNSPYSLRRQLVERGYECTYSGKQIADEIKNQVLLGKMRITKDGPKDDKGRSTTAFELLHYTPKNDEPRDF